MISGLGHTIKVGKENQTPEMKRDSYNIESNWGVGIHTSKYFNKLEEESGGNVITH